MQFKNEINLVSYVLYILLFRKKASAFRHYYLVAKKIYSLIFGYIFSKIMILRLLTSSKIVISFSLRYANYVFLLQFISEKIQLLYEKLNFFQLALQLINL
jgi:hypothetical protein